MQGGHFTNLANFLTSTHNAYSMISCWHSKSNDFIKFHSKYFVIAVLSIFRQGKDFLWAVSYVSQRFILYSTMAVELTCNRENLVYPSN